MSGEVEIGGLERISPATGISVVNKTIDGYTVGGTTAGSGTFTSLSASSVSSSNIQAGGMPVLPVAQYTSISSGNGTLTGAQVAGAQFVALLTSGATALTTPNAAAMLAAIPNGTSTTMW